MQLLIEEPFEGRIYFNKRPIPDLRFWEGKGYLTKVSKGGYEFIEDNLVTMFNPINPGLLRLEPTLVGVSLFHCPQ